MSENAVEGGCLCGRVRYRVSGAPRSATSCHCATCRRASGAPYVAWATFPPAEFVFTGPEPARFRSSADVERSFCPRCGTPLTYQSRRFPDEVDVTIASLDAPEAVAPADHTWVSRKLPWVRLADGLPAFERSRAEG